jgi:cobalt-zinc-cadmium efflux system protein
MTRASRLFVVMALNLGLVAGLIVVAVTAHSLAVLAEGGDYLIDAAAVGVALLALRLSAHQAGDGRPGIPWRHATEIAALINVGWLLVLELIVAVAAVERLARGVGAVDGLPVLVISAVAAVTMTLGALVLRGDAAPPDGPRDLSIAAVLLDTVADAAAAAAVAAVGAIIFATGALYWLDPVAALAVAVIVGYHAVKLFQKTIRQLRSGGHSARAEATADVRE